MILSWFTSIGKLQSKGKAIGELDVKIVGEIQNEELEKDVSEAIELQNSITEEVDQIKCFISCHMKPDEVIFYLDHWVCQLSLI